MKLKLTHSKIIRKRLIGLDREIDLQKNLYQHYSELLFQLLNSHGLHLVSDKLYLEILPDKRLMGPFREIEGVNFELFSKLTLVEIIDGDSYFLPLDSKVVASGAFFETYEVLKAKISFKKAFLTLELDKIGLLFFN